MADVQFTDENVSSNFIAKRPTPQPFMVRAVIKSGLAKNVAGANVVLIIISIICIIFAFYFFRSGKSETIPTGVPTPANEPL